MNKKLPKITTLFLDIGGVLLSNGWDREARKAAAKTFSLDYEEMEERHHLTFDTYECGKIDLKEYLRRTVFYQRRNFSPGEFQKFMYAQSRPYPKMLQLLTDLKVRYGLKIVAVNNEAREFNAYRIQKFKLKNFIDFFVSSCYVHLRKPDLEIFQRAFDMVHTPASQIIYIDDREMFIMVAKELGIQGIHHTDYASTCEKLRKFSLFAEE